MRQIIGTTATVQYDALRKAVEGYPWFERLNYTLKEPVEQLARDGEIETFWSKGPDKLPMLNVRVLKRA